MRNSKNTTSDLLILAEHQKKLRILEQEVKEFEAEVKKLKDRGI